MAKHNKKDNVLSGYIWDNITSDDFITGSAVEDCDIGTYNKSNMAIFQANVNYGRQLAKAADSLKPVERRILYTLHELGAYDGNNIKSNKILGALAAIHSHSDDSAYGSMINMAQYWKRSQPMITGNCNLGTIIAPNEYGASRYTEMYLTPYAYECFFEDYDKKAVQMTNTLTGAEDPRTLPTKFPNILVNGNSGIGNGYSANILPFNIDDIIENCTKLIKNPDTPVEDLIMAPDLPTECDIVENKSEISEFCKTGYGKLTMRGRIDIEDTGNTWTLTIRSIPYGISYPSVKEKIYALGKNGIIPFKSINDSAETYVMKDGQTRKNLRLVLEIPKALDPLRVKSMLYKNCDMEKTTVMQSYVVTDIGKLNIPVMNIKDIMLAWIYSRRIYKRSLYLHTYKSLASNIQIYDALITLLDKKNLEKTINAIKTSTDDNLVENLMKIDPSIKLNSFQAKAIAERKLSSFTETAKLRYIESRAKAKEKFDYITDIIHSPSKMDNIIIDELKDLAKYSPHRRMSKLITVINESDVSPTNHRIVITNSGLVKKLPEEVDSHYRRAPFGSFAPNDSIRLKFTANNLDWVMLFNEFGRYSLMPIYDIPNTVYSDNGTMLEKVCGLYGGVTRAMCIESTVMSGKTKPKKKAAKAMEDSFVVSLSGKGYAKRTNINEYLPDKITSVKNSVASKIKSDDIIIDVGIIPAKYVEKNTTMALVVTKHGSYTLLPFSVIPEFGKNSSGLKLIDPTDGDECACFTMFDSSVTTYITIVTKRGYVKKIEYEYLGHSKKRKDNSYISALNGDDEIVAALACTDNDTIAVSTRAGVTNIDVKDIPTKSRKAAPVKMISVLASDAVTHVTFAETEEE